MKPRFKPLDRPECEDTWFCYFMPPRGQGKPSVLAESLSQVPDLNIGKKSSTLGTEGEKTYVRGAVHPNDSKYIRLAKAGGRKHLLTFSGTPPTKVATEPLPYPVSEWYYDDYHSSSSSEGERGRQAGTVKNPRRPDWMTHLEYDPTQHRKTAAYHPNRGIIAWDKMSAWKREEFERKMQQKTKNIYENKRREERSGHEKKINGKSKVNNDGGLSEATRLRLPKITTNKLPGMRKLSGADLKVNWYKKWYVINRV
jgi:hypothetical protein